MPSNTSYVPSSADLLMVVPRLARKIGSFAWSNMPEQVDTVVSKIRNGGSFIAESTAGEWANSTVSNSTSLSAQGVSTATTATAAAVTATASAGTAASATGGGYMSYFAVDLSLERFQNFGGIFSYLGSRWALTIFLVVSSLLSSYKCERLC